MIPNILDNDGDETNPNNYQVKLIYLGSKEVYRKKRQFYRSKCMLDNQYQKLKAKGKKIQKLQIFGNPDVLLEEIIEKNKGLE